MPVGNGRGSSARTEIESLQFIHALVRAFSSERILVKCRENSELSRS